MRSRILFVALVAAATTWVVVLAVREPPSARDWWVLAACFVVTGVIACRTEFLVTAEPELDGEPGFSMIYDASEALREACMLLVPIPLAGFLVLPNTMFGMFWGNVPNTNPVPRRLMLGLMSASLPLITFTITIAVVREIAEGRGPIAALIAASVGVALFASFTVAIDCSLYLLLRGRLPVPWYLGFAGHLLPIDVAGLFPVVLLLDEPLGVQVIGLLPALALVLVRMWVLEHFADQRRRAGEQSLLARAAAIAEEGRAALVRELHDGPLQSLLALRLAIDQSDRTGEHLPPETMLAGLDRAAGDLREALERGRRQTSGDLADAIHTVVDVLAPRFPGGIAVTGTEDAALPDHVAAVAYEIILEAARNAAQHGGGSKLDIDLSSDGASVRIDVADDGAGFQLGADRSPGHLGIRVMRERVEAAGGELEVRSAPGEGTVVTAILPLVLDDRRQQIY